MEEAVTTDTEPKYINAFSDLSSYKRLTCDIHENCDLSCDPSNPPSVRPVDLTLYDSSDDSSADECIPGNPGNPGNLDYTMTPRLSRDLYVPERDGPITVDTSLPAFAYDTLHSSSIRLLHIKAAIYLADRLDCELISVPIDESPPFDALSYCWGISPRQTRIMVNGKQHQITDSLADSLHRYRRLGNGTISGKWKGKSKYIWADGICIDQSNTEEKNDQVQLMQKIYSRAHAVFINLGYVPDNWIAALFLMKSVAFLLKHEYPLMNQEVLFEKRFLPPLYHSAWLAYGYLFEQPWFKRLWVIQEMALSARDPIVMFGRYSFNLGLHFDTADFLLRQGYCSAFQAYHRKRSTGFLNTLKMKHIRADFRHESSSALSLLENVRDLSATDPRDRIFALQSIMRPPDRLVINYKLSAEDIYKQFAIQQVHNNHGSRLLNTAGLHRRSPGSALPTWVPDWRAQEQSPRLICYIRETPYRASGDLVDESKVQETNGDLYVFETRGIILDTIQALSDTMSTADGYVKVKQALDLSRAISTKQSSRYTDDADALTRTLLMDDLYSSDHNTIPTLSEIQRPSDLLEAYLREPQSGETSVTETRLRVYTAAQVFQMQLETCCSQRKFAVSSSGYFSLVPVATKLGDVVSILSGAPVPHILRLTNDENHFELVGDSYVHGIMAGEALNDPNLRILEIFIR
ncbi:hypothetical protein NQ176_g956 [Zarea fungicola]|uniref:Uncharacterized protein n=1 Tax=Zarea fungicola TaxID=93591 RepID=A0ACC1NW02_9HYPO|nr:hypothetical protein NQ176_g956 [Lecanicillium fungicola]